MTWSCALNKGAPYDFHGCRMRAHMEVHSRHPTNKIGEWCAVKGDTRYLSNQLIKLNFRRTTMRPSNRAFNELRTMLGISGASQRAGRVILDFIDN